ncbi:hypothetical protein C8R43DRAFT_981451 [Mycena crocata]|nr:hypothetical protein C8R43DRAFT_981451 [Mycena crocata]
MPESARRTRLNKLGEEISLLRLRLQELEEEREEIFTSLTFTVLALPAEVTSEIFIHCVPSVSSPPSKPKPSVAPLLLTGICRQWRNIALTTPRLWSTFCFPAAAPKSEAREGFIKPLALLLWESATFHRILPWL